MTKITEDLLIERGFREFGGEGFGLLLDNNRVISIFPFQEKWSIYVDENFRYVTISSNLLYIEDLDKFISICNL